MLVIIFFWLLLLKQNVTPFYTGSLGQKQSREPLKTAAAPKVKRRKEIGSCTAIGRY